MYFCDSPTRRILAYDYSGRDGVADTEPPSNPPQLFYEMPSEDVGFPDGSTVDSEDCLWSAEFGASRVVRLGARGGATSRVKVDDISYLYVGVVYV